ncbi:MAG: hypothetical protein KF746_04100 [Chitinophagaceae bacterium]|nr:hypothetical protein [Chitinophagaceae bacterium]
MQRTSYIAIIFFQAIVLAGGLNAFAQEPGKKQTIDITSSFKPVLKPAAKINFDAAPPVPDSAKPRFSYDIPVTSLSRVYQPLSISPLALNIDSTRKWSASNFVKLGYGNYQTPFAQAGLTFTNGTNSTLNILGNFIASKGSAIEHQSYGKAGASAYGSTTTAGKQELYGKLSFEHNLYYLYGYDHSLYNYSKSSLRQRFLSFDANVGFRNTEPTEFGLKYHPDVKLNFFNDNHDAREFNGVVNLPLQKSIGDALTVKLGVNADYTQLSKKGASAINNTIVTIPLALQFKNEMVNIHGGAIPSWDNSDFKLLPDLMADFKLGGDELIVQLGWLMHYDKGSYKRFASVNPYISQPNFLFNTRINETYGGIKGTFLEHFFYNIKVGLAQFYNMPLFVNDTIPFSDGKNFSILKEEKLNAFQMHGEAGVVQAEDFSLTAKFDWMLFNKQKTYAEPWGIIPRELTMAMRWRVLKDLWLKSDLFFFEGAKYRQTNGSTDQATHPVDLNAGLEFKVTRQFNLWLQTNNIFNNKYQRWHQYHVYGFNILGGIVFNFSK